MYKEIKTERITLRPLEARDLADRYAYASDPELTKYMRDMPEESLEETAQFIEKAEEEWKKEKPAFYEFVIEFEGKHIGSMSIYPDDSYEEAELGWILLAQYQRKGIITEAARGLFRFSAEDLHIRHLIAHCDSENYPSYLLLEKEGFQRTKEYGGRKNRSADHESIEYLYEKWL